MLNLEFSRRELEYFIFNLTLHSMRAKSLRIIFVSSTWREKSVYEIRTAIEGKLFFVCFYDVAMKIKELLTE